MLGSAASQTGVDYEEDQAHQGQNRPSPRRAERIARRIEGLVIRPVKPQVDQRGELVEIYNPAWKFHPEPLVYAYQVTLRPGSIRGWVIHKTQEDRIHICLGVQRWVFYDDRKDSPTHGLINQFVSPKGIALVCLPRGVYHAVQNIGETGIAVHQFAHAA